MTETAEKNGLAKQLAEEPYEFDFFQAVRLLERLYPDRQPVGFDHLPAREVVRFRVHPPLTFQPSAVHDIIDHAEEDLPAEMVVAFMGLYGQQGALPQHYSELILRRMSAKDRTLRDFLDLFNHRLISLFYRAGTKYRFWIPSERTYTREGRLQAEEPEKHRSFVMRDRSKQDLFSQILTDLSGLGMSPLRFRTDIRQKLEGRTAISDDSLRFYTGLLAQRHRSAVGLETLLQDFFETGVRVVQFAGQWLVLDQEDQSQMVAGGNMHLGLSCVAGDRVWDVQSKFRICLGPLRYEEYCRFLPPGSAFRPLTQLARLYAGAHFDFEIELGLLTREIPPCQLGASEGFGARLGWNTWIQSGEFSQDVAKVTILVQDSLLRP